MADTALNNVVKQEISRDYKGLRPSAASLVHHVVVPRNGWYKSSCVQSNDQIIEYYFQLQQRREVPLNDIRHFSRKMHRKQWTNCETICRNTNV